MTTEGYWKRVGDELAVRSDDLLVVDYKGYTYNNSITQ
jgi:hypothetical protein